jgi:hypothetical protein
MRQTFCLCACVPLPATSECLKLGMYIMAPEPISTACLINLLHQVKVKVKVTLRPTFGQSVSKFWYRYYSLTVTVLFSWGALPDERIGVSFVYATGPCPRSLSRVRVPWDSGPYFTVSDVRLKSSSPPMTRRVTVEVFDPASTRRQLIPYIILFVCILPYRY